MSTTQGIRVRKVIGFDSWTGGAHHYQRLVEAFRAEGFELTLVHIGSWGGDKGRPATEQIGNIQVRDISAYPGRRFVDILDVEQPAAVLFLSTDTFAHRAFNRYCQQRNIPTVHLYHGLVAVQALDGAQYKVNVLAQFRFVTTRILKALTLVWPRYAHALWVSGAKRSDWYRFVSDIVAGGFGRKTSTSAPDAKTDACCVYVAADIEHATQRYGFAPDRVTAVGNPDLIRFGVQTQDIGADGIARNAANRDVMYLDTGLIYTGFVFDSPEQFIAHLVETQTHLARAGRRLLFKPHPDHSRTDIPKRLQEAGIEVCTNENFVARLRSCCSCIVEPSTLAMLPGLMGLPLFLAQYGQLRGQRFGRVLLSYPRARALVDMREFEVLLKDVEDSPQREKTQNWIEHNSGPLPAEEMPTRVARIVSSLVSRLSVTEWRADEVIRPNLPE